LSLPLSRLNRPEWGRHRRLSWVTVPFSVCRSVPRYPGRPATGRSRFSVSGRLLPHLGIRAGRRSCGFSLFTDARLDRPTLLPPVPVCQSHAPSAQFATTFRCLDRPAQSGRNFPASCSSGQPYDPAPLLGFCPFAVLLPHRAFRAFPPSIPACRLSSETCCRALALYF